MRIRFSGASLVGLIVAVVIIALVSLLALDNPQFIAWAKRSGLSLAIPRVASTNPFSNHLAYTITGPVSSHTLKKSFYAQAGSTITIHYAFQFDNRSTPNVTLYPPDFLTNSVWREAIKVTQGEATVTAPATGYYRLTLTSWGYCGDFDIWWEVKK